METHVAPPHPPTPPKHSAGSDRGVGPSPPNRSRRIASVGRGPGIRTKGSPSSPSSSSSSSSSIRRVRLPVVTLVAAGAVGGGALGGPHPGGLETAGSHGR
ncbi:unnamed protein product [Gadus morhua 'NCC']